MPPRAPQVPTTRVRTTTAILPTEALGPVTGIMAMEAQVLQPLTAGHSLRPARSARQTRSPTFAFAPARLPRTASCLKATQVIMETTETTETTAETATITLTTQV